MADVAGESGIGDLVAAAQRGEPGAMDHLLRHHLDDVRAFVRLQVGPELRARESCSDLVQSLCREVLEDLPGFEYRGSGSFRHWLFTAALNKVRQKHNFHTAQKRDVAREVPLEGVGAGSDGRGLYDSLCTLGATPSEVAVAHEQLERIEAAMEKLPPDYRQVLILARLVGLSHTKVAAEMGRTENAVRTLLSRAKLRLLAVLEERE